MTTDRERRLGGKGLACVVVLGFALINVAVTFVAIVQQSLAPRPWRIGLNAAALAIAIGLIALLVHSGRRRERTGSDVVAAFVAAFVMIALVQVIAAPVFHAIAHRRPRNESATVGNIRTMISAQAAYQSANGGFFDRPECLNEPHRCIPGYPVAAPTFLDPGMARPTVEKSGYRLDFHAGSTVARADVARLKVSPSSLSGFAYVAVPIIDGEGADRSFCGDESGRVCVYETGRRVVVKGGQCPSEGCVPYQ
jgi:hypothetical protein